jgi:hypothetical protein
LPLGKTQAAALKKHAHQAPYGKGEQTLVDTNVRRVWEIDADELTLANPEWPKILRRRSNRSNPISGWRSRSSLAT